MYCEVTENLHMKLDNELYCYRFFIGRNAVGIPQLEATTWISRAHEGVQQL